MSAVGLLVAAIVISTVGCSDALSATDGSPEARETFSDEWLTVCRNLDEELTLVQSEIAGWLGDRQTTHLVAVQDLGQGSGPSYGPIEFNGSSPEMTLARWFTDQTCPSLWMRAMS